MRKASDSDSALARVFAEAAAELRGEVLFVVSDVLEGVQEKMGEFLGLTNETLPAIRVLNPTDMSKFSYEGNLQEVTVPKIKAFLDDFKNKRLLPAMISEEPPAQNDGLIKTVVGKTHKQLVTDPPSDVFIMYHAPWCSHCKALSPQFDALAEELKTIAPHLSFAKMDATSNEVLGLDIRGYPTLKLYTKENKESPIEYGGNKDKEGMREFLSVNSKAYQERLGGAG